MEYTSSSIINRDQFHGQYGRRELRAKTNNPTGAWPTTWTLGIQCQWPRNSDVDARKNYGEYLLANFGWGTDQRRRPQWDSAHGLVSKFGAPCTHGFHIWSLIWNENHITITGDDEAMNTVNLNPMFNGSGSLPRPTPPYHQHRYLLLNLALGGHGGSIGSRCHPTPDLVDYLRIYQ